MFHLTFSIFKRIIYRPQYINRLEKHLQENDKTLIAGCKQGDMNAFKKLMLKHQGHAFALAFRSLGDEDDANDVVQECFIRIWRNIDNFDQQRKFTTWMYRIVCNLCIDRLCQRRRHAVAFSRLESGKPLLNGIKAADFEQNLKQKELGDWINLLAQRLTPKQRLVFVLRDLQGMSIEEVGQTLQMRTAAVKSNLHLARRQIRKLLLEIDPELRNMTGLTG